MPTTNPAAEDLAVAYADPGAIDHARPEVVVVLAYAAARGLLELDASARMRLDARVEQEVAPMLAAQGDGYSWEVRRAQDHLWLLAVTRGQAAVDEDLQEDLDVFAARLAAEHAAHWKTERERELQADARALLEGRAGKITTAVLVAVAAVAGTLAASAGIEALSPQVFSPEAAAAAPGVLGLVGGYASYLAYLSTRMGDGPLAAGLQHMSSVLAELRATRARPRSMEYLAAQFHEDARSASGYLGSLHERVRTSAPEGPSR